jgi:hypothetical protein
MPIDDVADLIRRFEPVLFFHPDERFFPSDAKRYVENSTIWTVEGAKADDKTNWGGSGPGHFPRHPKFRPPIAALAGEAGSPVDAALGGGVVESFLSFAGWTAATWFSRTAQTPTPISTPWSTDTARISRTDWISRRQTADSGITRKFSTCRAFDLSSMPRPIKD